MTSKADDFGVRYDDGDGNGWDTQGFRRAEDNTDYGPPTEAFTPHPDYGQQAGGDPEYGAPSMDYGQQANGYSPVSGYQTRQVAVAPGRRGARHGGRGGAPGGPGGPAGPGGPGGPSGPGGPGGPRRRGLPGRARGPRVKVKGSWWRRWTLRKALGVLASLFASFVVLLALVVVYVYNKTPVPTEQMAALAYQPSMIYAADGKTYIGRFGSENHQNVNYAQIPPQIIYSVLAAEDRSFFTEGGVSPSGILRAAYSDTIGGGNFQGGSTITQEFVRQYYQGIGTAQTVSRKIKEIFVAMKIARSKSKEWILENYLNTIYLGEGSYGIGAAARTYFNIPVSKLSTITWAQAALLAAIIQQPSTFPLPQYRSNLETRWHYVLQGLVTIGKLTQAQANALKFPSFGKYSPHNYGSDMWDPYVVDVVKNELMDVYHYTEAQLDNNGYKIITTIDPVKMKALYAAIQTRETQMTADGEGLQSYMHVGAVLENPQDSSVEAMYAGPGFIGAKYNGVGHVITAKECARIHCEVNMAVYNREQVGSSFKPYILATAVAQGMNVQTSMLDGQNYVCIPPDKDLIPADQNAFPDATTYPNCQPSWYKMTNDNPGENGAFNPTDAMTNSINTAYADLWHYVGGHSVVHMAKMFGVDTVSSGLDTFRDEAGVALGQASLTVGEQATMLSAIANGGVYHQIHIVKQVTQGSVQAASPFNTWNVFDKNSTINQNEATQVQAAMQNVIYKGTAAGNGMSDGRQIISKTGTTNNATSTFFIGAIPQQVLAIGMFTDRTDQTLNGLGGVQQNFGGTWSAEIWNTYAENMFLPIQAQSFPAPVFTGSNWTLAPKNLLNKKHKKHTQHKGQQPASVPTPTATCVGDNITVDCNPASPSPQPSSTNQGTAQLPPVVPSFGGAATQASAVAGVVVLLPASLFWFRRLERRKAARQVDRRLECCRGK